jgi:hypothetical protein
MSDFFMQSKTEQGLSEKEQYFERQAQAGQSINYEFDHLPSNQQLQIIEDIRTKRSNDPGFLPDLAISGGSGQRNSAWHLRATRNTSDQPSPPAVMAGKEELDNKQAIESRLKEAARWHMSQHGDDPKNPQRWYACSATSLHMALLHLKVQSYQQTEQQRKRLIEELNVSTRDGFHGGTPMMAKFAKNHGLNAEAHLNNNGVQNEIIALDAALIQHKGAITNGGVLRPDGSILKHYIYVSDKVGDCYVVGDPENDKPVVWTHDQMLNFLKRGSHGFVAVCR